MNVFDSLPKRSAILVIGKPRSEKNIFAYQFLYEGLKKGEKCLVITTNNFPEDIIAEMIKFGDFSPPMKNLVRFVDCYTRFIGIPKEDEKDVIRTEGPGHLNEVNISISRSLRQFEPARVVFDSATTLLLQNTLSDAEKFFLHFTGKMRKSATSLILVDEGAHQEREITALEGITRQTIYFKSGKNNNYIEMSGYNQNKMYYVYDGAKIRFKELAKV